MDNKKQTKPGPPEKRISIQQEGGWMDAVRKALKKKRPKEGWPNRDRQAGGSKKNG